MTRISVAAVAMLFLAVFSTGIAQNQGRKPGEATTFPVRLLPGYRVGVASDIDSWGAKIWKDGGVTIQLYAGRHIGIDADSIDEKDVDWRAEQVLNTQRVICVYTKSNDLIVSIPRLAVNFRGHIQNPHELSEMLLMVLTYEPNHGYPFEPGTVTVMVPRP